MAGIRRLGLDVAYHPIDPTEMLPAACRGAIGLEARLDDMHIVSLCAAIGDAQTRIAVTAERAFLVALDGSCRTPIAALARIDNDHIVLEGLIARPDGSSVVRMRHEGQITSARLLGSDMGRQIKGKMPLDFFVTAE